MRQIHWVGKFLTIYLGVVTLITIVGIVTPIVDVTYEGWISYLVSHYIVGAFIVGASLLTFVLPLVLLYRLAME